MDIFSDLPVTRLTPYIKLTQHEHTPILLINHPTHRAAISLQGAHLLRFQPTDEQPVIWLSKNAVFEEGVPIRGGIPICFPWFGNAHVPAHGFARTQRWQLKDYHDHKNHITVTLQLTDNPATRALWNHPFTLIAHFKLGATCQIELEMVGDFSATAALHTYLEVSDVRQISVSGMGPSHHESLNTINHPAVEGELVFNQEVNRIYTKPDSISLIHDRFYQRTIQIAHHNASDVVAWNPWSDTSKNMSDMAKDGYKTMVCLETARINNPLIATPKKACKLGLEISIT